VPKSTKDIAQQVQEIFALARASETPITVLSLQSTLLLGQDDWTPAEVERVSSEVLELLIKHGWKRAGV
jgi:hypothetical protein